MAEKDLRVRENIKTIALVIITNLLKLFGLEVNENEVLYRVCIGVYRDKNNAMKQVELAKNKGFKDSYIMN